MNNEEKLKKTGEKNSYSENEKKQLEFLRHIMSICGLKNLTLSVHTENSNLLPCIVYLQNISSHSSLYPPFLAAVCPFANTIKPNSAIHSQKHVR